MPVDVLPVRNRLPEVSFLSFQAERHRPTPGLIKPLESANPIQVHCHVPKILWRDIRDAPTWRDRFRCFVKPSGREPSTAARGRDVVVELAASAASEGGR